MSAERPKGETAIPLTPEQTKGVVEKSLKNGVEKMEYVLLKKA
jgi:hypothetical protein